MNIVFDFNDPSGCRMVLLEDDGSMYLAEGYEDLPSPYTTIHSVIAADLINAAIEAHVGPNEIRQLARK